MAGSLVERLQARIAEQEEQAPDVHDAYCLAVTQVEWGSRVYDAKDCECGEPARVLAWCAAMRAIVELHENAGEYPGQMEDACSICGTFGEYGVPYPCETLRLLAQGLGVAIEE